MKSIQSRVRDNRTSARANPKADCSIARRSTKPPETTRQQKSVVRTSGLPLEGIAQKPEGRTPAVAKDSRCSDPRAADAGPPSQLRRGRKGPQKRLTSRWTSPSRRSAASKACPSRTVYEGPANGIASTRVGPGSARRPSCKHYNQESRSSRRRAGDWKRPSRTARPRTSCWD